MTPAQFRSLFPSPAWSVDIINYNVGISPKVAPLFSVLRKISFIEKFATVSIYAHIRKVGTSRATTV